MQISLRIASRTQILTVECEPHDSLEILRKKAIENDDSLKDKAIQFIFRGKCLEEKTTLKEMRIAEESTLHVVISDKSSQKEQDQPTTEEDLFKTFKESNKIQKRVENNEGGDKLSYMTFPRACHQVPLQNEDTLGDLLVYLSELLDMPPKEIAVFSRGKAITAWKDVPLSSELLNQQFFKKERNNLHEGRDEEFDNPFNINYLNGECVAGVVVRQLTWSGLSGDKQFDDTVEQLYKDYFDSTSEDEYITVYRVDCGNPFNEKDRQALIKTSIFYMHKDLNVAVNAAIYRSKETEIGRNLKTYVQTIVMRKADYIKLQNVDLDDPKMPDLQSFWTNDGTMIPFATLSTAILNPKEVVPTFTFPTSSKRNISLEKKAQQAQDTVLKAFSKNPKVIDSKNPKVIDSEKPKVIDSEKPEIIDSEKPEIIDSKKPKVIDSEKPEIEHLMNQLHNDLQLFLEPGKEESDNDVITKLKAMGHTIRKTHKLFKNSEFSKLKGETLNNSLKEMQKKIDKYNMMFIATLIGRINTLPLCNQKTAANRKEIIKKLGNLENSLQLSGFSKTVQEAIRDEFNLQPPSREADQRLTAQTKSTDSSKQPEHRKVKKRKIKAETPQSKLEIPVKTMDISDITESIQTTAKKPRVLPEKLNDLEKSLYKDENNKEEIRYLEDQTIHEVLMFCKEILVKSFVMVASGVACGFMGAILLGGLASAISIGIGVVSAVAVGAGIGAVVGVAVGMGCAHIVEKYTLFSQNKKVEGVDSTVVSPPPIIK